MKIFLLYYAAAVAGLTSLPSSADAQDSAPCSAIPLTLEEYCDSSSGSDDENPGVCEACSSSSARVNCPIIDTILLTEEECNLASLSGESISDSSSGESFCEELSVAYEAYCNWCRRLGEIRTFEGERALRAVEERGGDIRGIVTHEDDVLPEEACDALRGYLDELYEAEKFDLENIDRGVRNLPREEVYDAKLDGAMLVELIGRDNAKSLLDYYHRALGEKFPVTKIGLQLARNRLKEKQHFTHHRDHKPTLLVFIRGNDESFQGGHLNYLTAEGQVNFDVKLGRAVVHGPDTIHGATSWTGDRYVLALKSDDAGGDCLLKKYVE